MRDETLEYNTFLGGFQLPGGYFFRSVRIDKFQQDREDIGKTKKSSVESKIFHFCPRGLKKKASGCTVCGIQRKQKTTEKGTFR